MESTVPTLSATRRTNSSTNSHDLKEDKTACPSSFAPKIINVSSQTSHVKLKPRSNNSILLILAAGCALLSDGYQNSLMTMTNVVFKTRYGSKIYNGSVSTRISNASLVGAIIGQIVVGIICDRVGRKAGVSITTALLVLGAIFATAAYPVNGKPENMFWWLTVARGCVGLGVGGEYPASSTSASEAANQRLGKKHRSQVFILVTNLVLAFGTVVSLSFFLILLKITGYNDQNDPAGFRDLGIIWRVVFGFGALFPLIIFYFRMLVLNSELYRKTAMRKKVPYMLALRRYWKRLLGTAGVWFVYDFVVFPLGVFSGTIISTVVKNPTLLHVAEWQLLLSSIGIPGVILGVLALPKFGSRLCFMLGLGGFVVLGLIIGLSYDKIVKISPLFVILFGLISAVGNFGPGNQCGLVSAEIYPSSLRGTFYGISAAFGKTGAAVGVQVFTPIQHHLGKKWVFIISACLGLIGIALVYFCIPETTKFDLAEEDRNWLTYLVDNGWQGEVGDGTEPVISAKEAIERVKNSDADQIVVDEESSKQEREFQR
ncbi:related to GIT1 - Glycerophosphoinositol transporter also able to mediate low-affinity phosphate transport [Melanopsichium pennsylvanicum]|uniref:Related to GIT1 - Glycerophosphoinositol transporter also able to mediate low-affinity phosphate transport n=2 Tax=Melanopsichium pennsylvanicum TaxID=63383 RepID=A0AAJ5C5G6_9BASI|nr:related to GIT1-Glycerophosphoinositol transporter also able to mediate low-affinity phosphate transport [Melanopsichium pennsylvanicum 4]SNX84509.1 related to GIT1 - Glycerophosphoinositol transporter also able to mediate low-affinity phosphate transport [Melanopsichium pennsylvanicum]